MPEAGIARGAVLLDIERRWQCPSCGIQDVTRMNQPHTQMHPCRALRGVIAPLVEVHGLEFQKHSVRHVVNEREDYVGTENVRTDAEGRPVMSINTERADGSNDCHVFAPTASGHSAY